MLQTVKEFDYNMTKPIKRTIPILLAFAVIITALIIPTSGTATASEPISSDMYNNDFLDALAYTGFKVDKLKSDGNLFRWQSGGSYYDYLSPLGYTYDTSGYESKKSLKTKTGKAPDIKGMKSMGGLCCASYVTYVYFNYLPNIKGVDYSKSITLSAPRSAPSWCRDLDKAVSKGTATKITNVNKLKIGDILCFETEGAKSYGSYKGIGHLAIYLGENNGIHFLTDCGTDDGPRIGSIEASESWTVNGVQQQRFKYGYRLKKQKVGNLTVNLSIENSANGKTHRASKNSFVFELYNSKKKLIASETTNKSGIATFKNIPEGKYTLREKVTDKAGQYILPKDKTVTIKNKKTTNVRMSNYLVEFDFASQIKYNGKTQSISGNNFKGKYTYVLTGKTTAGAKVTRTSVTDSKGNVKFKNLHKGTYTITLKKEGNASLLNASDKKTVSWKKSDSKGLKTSKIVQSPKTGNITVNTDVTGTAQNDENTLEATDDLVYRLSGTSSAGIKVNITSRASKNGTVSFKNIPYGKFYVLVLSSDTADKQYPVQIALPKQKSVSLNSKNKSPKLTLTINAEKVIDTV